MNLNDLLIIYFACGAPFGVYFFFEKRKSYPTIELLIKTFLICLIWIPFSIKLLLGKKILSEKSSDDEIRLSEEISLIQKKLEKEILKSDIEISIFEFREVAERYIGLTFAKQNAENIIVSENSESELYSFSENTNPELSTICLNRRNRNRLLFHHKNARQDFLDILSLANDEKNLGFLAFEFVTLLNDQEAQNALIEMFSEVEQIGEIQPVKNSERDLWKTEKHKQFPARQLSIRLQTLIATANLRRKD